MPACARPVPSGGAAGSQGLMSVPGVEQVAVVVAREQMDVARGELTAKARAAGPGVAMVGGGALLAALASGTGTAALILLLARRPGASAAALGVTGAYAGAGAVLARKGLVRLREAPPLLDVPVQEEPVQNAKQDLGSAKRRTKSAAKSPPQPTGRPKPESCHRVLAVALPVRRWTARAGERPELLARLKAARAETGRALAADEAGTVATPARKPRAGPD
jgi:hypothetical protein